MGTTRLKSLLDEVDWHNRNGTPESFRNAAYKAGKWAYRLYKLGRFDPNKITVVDRKGEGRAWR